jgi:hypothetical protein
MPNLSPKAIGLLSDVLTASIALLAVVVLTAMA